MLRPIRWLLCTNFNMGQPFRSLTTAQLKSDRMKMFFSPFTAVSVCLLRGWTHQPVPD